MRSWTWAASRLAGTVRRMTANVRTPSLSVVSPHSKAVAGARCVGVHDDRQQATQACGDHRRQAAAVVVVPMAQYHGFYLAEVQSQLSHIGCQQVGIESGVDQQDCASDFQPDGQTVGTGATKSVAVLQLTPQLDVDSR